MNDLYKINVNSGELQVNIDSNRETERNKTVNFSKLDNSQIGKEVSFVDIQ